MNIFFHCGGNTSISLNEINSIFLNQAKKLISDEDIVYVENVDIDESQVVDLQERLGSAVKISKEIGLIEAVGVSDIYSNVYGIILKELSEYCAKSEGKFRFAVNSYAKGVKLKSLLMNLKRELKGSRFLNSNFKNLISVVSKKQVIDKDGVEMNVIEHNGSIFISKTISVQDAESYSKRDYGKPVRDAKVGMLPPKLAQILINLSGGGESIWDPFCGLGVIPIEVLLMGFDTNLITFPPFSNARLNQSRLGFKQVAFGKSGKLNQICDKIIIASDIEQAMCDATRKNMDYIAKECGISDLPELQIFAGDVRDFVEVKCDAVVTEGYLGAPLEGNASDEHIRDTDDLLSDIWTKALENFAKNDIKNVVLCLPAFAQKLNKIRYLENTLEKIKVSKYNLSAMSESSRGTLVYKRKGQFVYREIVKLKLG